MGDINGAAPPRDGLCSQGGAQSCCLPDPLPSQGTSAKPLCLLPLHKANPFTAIREEGIWEEGREERLANTACARSRGFVPSRTDISWGAGGTSPHLYMAPKSRTVQSKTITVASSAATCDQKTHSWIFPEVSQDLKGGKYNMAGKLPEGHCKKDSAQQGGSRDGGRRIPSSGICPLPSTQDSLWIAGIQSYQQQGSGAVSILPAKK